MTVPVRTDTTAADRAFARFCRDGDVDALGETFDRTAPRLVIVAAHLAGSDHADDLVQTTFVEAIRCKDRFEPGRPVLPWLLTILTRRAANLRRARSREPLGDAELDALRDPAPGPADAAAERELHERLATALDALEGPYREVLALRLVHGLRPVEIARALDRPLGTVHAQLHRGAERLRGLLPRALGVLLAGMAGAGDGLAAVRSHVLDAARTSAMPAVAAATVLGGIGMKKILSVVAAAVAVLALSTLAFLRPWGGESPPPGATEISARSADFREEVPASDPTGAQPPDAERVAVASEDGVPAEAPVTFTGRVVAAESGAPLGGVVVTAIPWPRHLGRTVPTSWPAPEPAVTAADGTFALSVDQDDRVGVTIAFASDGRAPVWDSFDRLRGGVRFDVGDVPMLRGVPVSIRIVDSAGAPVEGLAVQIDPVGGRRDVGRFSLRGPGQFQYSGTDGRLPELTLPFGGYELTRTDTWGHLVEGPKVIELTAAELPRQDVTLHLVPPPTERTVSGIVVDTRGLPVAGVEVVASYSERPHAHPRGRTLDDGRFCLGDFRAESGEVRLTRVGDGFRDDVTDFEIVAPLEPVPLGADDVRVVVRQIARASLTVSVVDAETRAPVEAFRARASHVVQERETTEFGRYADGYGIQLGEDREHPGGVIRWDGLVPGSYLVFVEPADPELARAFGVPVELESGADARLRVELPRWRAIDVRVVDAAGEPVGGVDVDLLRSAGRTPIRPGRWTVPVEDAFGRGVSGTFLVVETARAVTDADGQVRLRVPPRVGVAALRARSRMVPETLLELPDVLPGSATFELVVEKHAAIEGTLRPLEVVHAYGPDAAARAFAALHVDEANLLLDDMPEVVAVDADTGRQGGWARVHDDGSFRMGPMAPGDYVLRFDFQGEGEGDEQTGFARVDGLASGETRRVDIDVAHLLPASVRGVVTRDGVPFDGGRLELILDGERRRVAVSPDGRFTAGRLLPGRAVPALTIVDADGREDVLLAERALDLRPGESVDATLQFLSRSAVVRVVDADGAPVPGLVVRLAAVDPILWMDGVRTDADGRAEFASAPRGELKVYGYTSDNAPVEFGRIEVPVGQREGTFELTWER